AVLSVCLSAAGWMPFLDGFAKLVEREPAPVEVAWIPDETSVADETPTKPEDEPKPDKNKPVKDKPRRMKPKDLPPAPEPAKIEEPKKKEAELVIKPPPPPEKKPPPPPPIDHRKQMVDQEKFPDEQDNPDAHFLAQKNHRTEHETRAKATNLVRNVESPNTTESEKSDNKQPDTGMKNDKLAELQNRDGQKNQVVRSSPMAGQEGQAAPKEAQPQGPLSMRDLTPKAAIDPTEAQKEREGLDKQEKEQGDLPMARVGKEGQRAVAATMGAKANLRLNNHTFDEIEGVQHAEDDRRAAAKAEKSHVAGHWDKMQQKFAAMHSSIENFVQDVKPGNQEELGTRASPFAAYITAMHRQIHKIFTLGFLADIELKHNSIYDDETLWTQLEIVLKPDGSVDAVHIVRTSGLLPFDTAALDAVLSAAPFPPPPEVIKRVNGKVYLDWQFHRNELACGTFNVDPHILNSVDERIVHDTSVTGEAGLQAAKAQQRAYKSGTAAAVAGAGASFAPSAQGSARPQAEPTESSGATGAGASASAEPATPSGPPPPEVNAEARQTVDGWFRAYMRGDNAWLAGWSALPFMAAGEVVARDAPALHAMYKQLLAEAPGKRVVDSVVVLTAADVQKKMGMMPPGGEADTMLFAIGKSGSDSFILLLKKSSQGWRVAGIDR
ncbi:MAG TPA: TonB family protein, partial [Polyangia bacterium]|nr:TonB family protein [Polyangia bacterium]